MAGETVGETLDDLDDLLMPSLDLEREEFPISKSDLGCSIRSSLVCERCLPCGICAARYRKRTLGPSEGRS